MNFVTKDKAMRVAFRAAGKMGLDSTQARPHELHLFARLSANENRYEFSLKHEEATNILAIAKGLRDRDAFIAVGMALGLVPVPVLNSVARPTAAAPVYFPDPNVFSQAAAGSGSNYESEAQALEGIYWGTHTLQTNEGVRIDRAPNLDFRTVQQTQRVAVAYTTDGTNDASSSTQNMQTGLEVKLIGAPVRFGGGDENRIIIDISTIDKTLIGGSASRYNYLFVRLVGAILKGSTTKQYLG